MTEEFELVELEYSEDDILYYLVDEDGVEVGFVIEEDGREVECYYEGYDEDDFEVVEEGAGEAAGGTAEEGAAEEGSPEEIAFEEAAPAAAPEASEPYVPERAQDHGYLHKLAAIAGHEGNKARTKAESKLEVVRGKAEVQADKAKKTVSEQADKAKAKAAQAKAEGEELGITRESVKETTADLNALAKEGAATAKELKEAYDDIMENFDFLIPKKVRRRLP